MKTYALVISTVGLLVFAPSAQSQSADDTESPVTSELEDVQIQDEVITYGKQNWGRHDGMNAFFSGDYETAEIEFEREFKSLKRGRSAIDNAGFLTDASQFQAESIGNATSSSAGIGGPGGGGVFQPQSNNSGNPAQASGAARSSDKKKMGSSTLMDGKVTYHDFAVTKYMAGLSEVKLGKHAEAKKSFKSSLTYDGGNYDARMRLGLIYLLEGDFDAAAKQLEKLDKQRKKCNKRKCEDAKSITESTVTLSNAILKEALAQ